MTTGNSKIKFCLSKGLGESQQKEYIHTHRDLLLLIPLGPINQRLFGGHAEALSHISAHRS